MLKELLGINPSGNGRIEERQRKQPLQRQAALSPSPTPKRSFFFFSSPSSQAKASSSPQNPSSPLLVLPAELRLQIFSYVVGGKKGYTVPLPTRSSHKCCNNVHYPHLRCCQSIVPLSTRSFPGAFAQQEAKPNALALLQTCRQIYHESIGLLYSSVRSLQVHWSRAYFLKDYEAPDLALVTFPDRENPHGLDLWLWMCKLMTERMTGLKVLRVELCMSRHFRISCDDLEKILRPLRKLKGLEVFEVEVYPGNVQNLVEDIRATVLAEPCNLESPSE
jgi:hypothetical protein